MGCAYGGASGLGEPKTDPREHQLCPELIDKGALSGNVRVIDISAGHSHSLAVERMGVSPRGARGHPRQWFE